MLNLRQIIKLYPIFTLKEKKEEVKLLINSILKDNILLSKDECIYICSLNDFDMIQNLFEFQNISYNLKEAVFIYYLHSKNYDFFKKIYQTYHLRLNNTQIIHYAFKNEKECDFIIKIFFEEQLYKLMSEKEIFDIIIKFNSEYRTILVYYLKENYKDIFEKYFYELFEIESDIRHAIDFLQIYPIFNIEIIYEKLSSYPIKEDLFHSSYFFYLYQKFPINLSFNHNLLLQNALIILNQELINFLVSFDEVIEKIDDKFINKQKLTYNYDESKIFLEEIIIRHKLKDF